MTSPARPRLSALDQQETLKAVRAQIRTIESLHGIVVRLKGTDHGYLVRVECTRRDHDQTSFETGPVPLPELPGVLRGIELSGRFITSMRTSA